MGNRNWAIGLYARLFAFGAKGDRTQRSTGRKTGKFKGFGDFINEAAERTRSLMQRAFREAVIKEYNKAKKKAIAKYGRR